MFDMLNSCNRLIYKRLYSKYSGCVYTDSKNIGIFEFTLSKSSLSIPAISRCRFKSVAQSVDTEIRFGVKSTYPGASVYVLESENHLPFNDRCAYIFCNYKPNVGDFDPEECRYITFYRWKDCYIELYLIYRGCVLFDIPLRLNITEDEMFKPEDYTDDEFLFLMNASVIGYFNNTLKYIDFFNITEHIDIRDIYTHRLPKYTI